MCSLPRRPQSPPCPAWFFQARGHRELLDASLRRSNQFGAKQFARRCPRMTSGLVLAAGVGSRFEGGFKLLAEVDGRPLVEHAIRAQCSVQEIERVVVVLGARSDEVLRSVDFGRAEPVICADWEAGVSASLKEGVDALGGPSAGRVIVTLGDSPTVTEAVIRRLLGAPAGSRAVYHGRPGHPVVLGPEQLERIATLAGDVGARGLLTDGALIECGDLATGIDIDTVADISELSGVPGAKRLQESVDGFCGDAGP